MNAVKTVEKNDLPLYFLSHTQINMFKRCRMQYCKRYEEKLKIPPPWTMYLGKVGHKALDFNFEQKIESYTDLDYTDFIEFYYDSFDNNPERESVNWQEEKPGQVKDMGYKVLENYYKELKVQKTIQPIAVQKKIEIEFENKPYALRTYLDIITDKEEVGDNKISRKTPDKNTLANDNQLTTYGLSYLYEYGKKPSALWFDYLIHLKSGPKYERFPVERTDEHYNQCLEDIGNIAIQIADCRKSGSWDRRMSGWECSPKYCGYYLLCRPQDKKIFYEVLEDFKKKGKK